MLFHKMGRFWVDLMLGTMPGRFYFQNGPLTNSKKGDDLVMNLRIQTQDKLVSGALETFRQTLERRNDRKYTLNQAVVELIKIYLIGGDTSQLRRVADNMEDLTAVLEEHLAAENILVYTLINGEPPKEGD